MSSAISALSLLFTTQISLHLFSDTEGSVIDALKVPPIVRNGTGPVDLSCIYRIERNENGLVIKWYHGADQIYQWIPPLPPRDVGIISGLSRYPEEHLQRPETHSIIRLERVTTDMAGDYVCMVSTFRDEAVKRARMIVYAPELNATIRASAFNATHLNLTCVAIGARPPPLLKFYIEGTEVEDNSMTIEETDFSKGDLWAAQGEDHPLSRPNFIADKRRGRSVSNCTACAIAYALGDESNGRRWWGKISTSSSTPQDYHSLLGAHLRRVGNALPQGRTNDFTIGIG
ncbi:hypothetical protein KM043_003088 [Ampulex compressa]|nr:hypothetical protein KM043_003088 [Ampulex compressa]